MPAGRAPIEGISAVTLLTADMAKAVAFYQALGFALRYGGADAEFSSFEAGASYLNLQLAGAEAIPTKIWGRVIFVVDDVDAMYRRAVSAGFTPSASPADAPWQERYFHIRDPDGHELSLARPLAQA